MYKREQIYLVFYYPYFVEATNQRGKVNGDKNRQKEIARYRECAV